MINRSKNNDFQKGRGLALLTHNKNESACTGRERRIEKTPQALVVSSLFFVSAFILKKSYVWAYNVAEMTKKKKP